MQVVECYNDQLNYQTYWELIITYESSLWAKKDKSHLFELQSDAQRLSKLTV